MKIKSIEEQVEILKRHFPKLKTVPQQPGSYLPEGAEGWFAIPDPEKIGGTYNNAVGNILAVIWNTRDLINYRGTELGSKTFQQSARSEQFWNKIREEQESDIFIVPTQTGKRYKGKSVEIARKLFVKNEFGLGVFAVGSILLTHPERLEKHEHLWIDCSGDEFDDADVAARWFLAPFFGFRGGQLGFGAYRVDGAVGLCGSASAFLPNMRVESLNIEIKVNGTEYILVPKQ